MIWGIYVLEKEDRFYFQLGFSLSYRMTSAVLGHDKPQLLNDLLAIGGKLVLGAGNARISAQKRNDFHLHEGEGIPAMHYKFLGDNIEWGRRKALRFVFFWLRKSIFAPQARSFSVLEKFCICLVSNRSRSSEKRTLPLGGEWISTPWKSLLFASSREIYAIFPKVKFLLCIFNSSFDRDFPSLHWISFLEL